MDFPQDSPRYTSPKPGGGLYGDSYFMGKEFIIYFDANCVMNSAHTKGLDHVLYGWLFAKLLSILNSLKFE